MKKWTEKNVSYSKTFEDADSQPKTNDTKTMNSKPNPNLWFLCRFDNDELLEAEFDKRQREKGLNYDPLGIAQSLLITSNNDHARFRDSHERDVRGDFAFDNSSRRWVQLLNH